MNEKFQIPRNVKVLGAISFLNDVASEIIYPLLPVFLNLYIGVSIAFIGLIEGIAESTASVLKLFSGWFSDKIQKRKVLAVIGYSLSSIIRPFVAISTAGWHVIVLRFLDRVGKGIRTSPRDALISDSTPPEYIGRAFGFHGSMDHLGAILGPLLSFGLIALLNSDLRQVFIFASIPGILVIIFSIMGIQEKLPQNDGKKFPKFTFKIFDRNYKAFLLSVGLFTLGNSSDAFLLLKAKSSGIDISLLPILWIVLHIVKFFSSYPSGILSDKIGRKPTIITGWLIYALVYFGFGFTNESYQIWVLFGIYGLFYGLTEGVEKAFISDLIPTNMKGTAFGVYNFILGIFALPSSVLFGLIWEKFGVAAAFLSGSALAFISMILLWLFVEEKKISASPSPIV